MKILRITSLMILLVLGIACPKPENGNRTRMILDDEASGNNVTVVKEKRAVRPDETVSDLKDLKTITQYDLEAKERTPSREVVYVKLGEPARPTEQKR